MNQPSFLEVTDTDRFPLSPSETHRTLLAVRQNWTLAPNRHNYVLIWSDGTSLSGEQMQLVASIFNKNKKNNELSHLLVSKDEKSGEYCWILSDDSDFTDEQLKSIAETYNKNANPQTR